MSIAEQDPNAAKVARETAAGDAPRRWLGKSLNRVEDPRFLRGQGRYLDDITLPGMLHAAVLRSPHAHARIVSVDTSKAETLPGVVRVVTGKDVAERAAPLPSFGAGPIVQDMIATEKVRHYGETVAAVIAESRYVAEDACDLIEVVYEPLPVVLDPIAARERGLAARPRGPRDEHRVRADVHVRRGRRGVRRGRPLGQRRALLASLDRDADGHERRDRRLRPGHGRRDDPRQLDELHVLPVADRRLAQDPRGQASARPRRRGRQLRLEVLHAQGADARRVPLDARGEAGEVRRGPDHPHHRERPLRLRPPLRGVARLRRRRHVPGAPHLVRRRLRRVPPVRHGHPRQRPVADRRPVSDPARRVLPRRRADEQEPAGRVSRVRRGGVELGARATRRPGRPRPRARSRRDPAPEPHPRRLVPVSHADGEHLRLGQLPGCAREGARGGRLRPLGRVSRAGSRRGASRGHRGRRVAGAQRLQLDGVLVLVRRPAVHARPRARRARASASIRPVRSSSRSTRSRCGATAPRPSSPRSSPRSSTSTPSRS